MSIRIVKPGVFTSLQDLGSSGDRRFGIRPGGAMDRSAVRLINTLLGNQDHAPTLEMHFPAAEIIFEISTTFAIGGAEFDAELDGSSVGNWRPLKAEKGSRLRFRGLVKGARSYLAIAGGFELIRKAGVPTVRIEARVELRSAMSSAEQIFTGRTRVSTNTVPRYSRFPTVRFISGPEADFMDERGRSSFQSEGFTLLPESDRMGFRFHGPELAGGTSEQMISSAVEFGTVQLLPDGQIVILMADHQTTGGYPRIAQIASVDLPLLAQMRAGDKAMFHRIELAEAEALAIQFEQDIAMMRCAILARK